MPAGKTIFVVNVPPYVQSEHLAEGFAVAGQVSHVIIADRKGVRHDTPSAAAADTEAASPYSNAASPLNQFKTAYVIFRSTKSLRNALGLTDVLLYKHNRTILQTGVPKWIHEHDRRWLDEQAIERQVNEYMVRFEQTEADQLAAAREADAVDVDGWTTVKKGRGAGFEQKESTLKRLETKIEDGKKKKELQNFYTFQIRESKKQHVVGLRKRFEDDKRKIETMKKARHFKPY